MLLGLQIPSLLFSISVLFCDVDAAPTGSSPVLARDSNNPLNIEWGPAPSREDGPPASANSLRDPAYLPAQIGGIVGSYALSLVLVAAALLALSKRRRQHLKAAEAPDDDDDDDDDLEVPGCSFPAPGTLPSQSTLPYHPDAPKSPVRNFSYPSPTSPTKEGSAPYIIPSTSSNHAPGVDLSVDQTIVAADRHMAQQQLEEMYKLVMEQEAAKEAGIVLQGPVAGAQTQRPPSNSSASTVTKREKNKPSNLILTKEEKKGSRTSSILSALKSPRKKKMQGINISSPIMTPMSGTFPQSGGGQEMNSIPPRHYAPAAPPPVPAGQAPFQGRPMGAPLTPEMSPHSTMSIDQRIGAQFGNPQEGHARNMSTATTEADPTSAVSDNSTTPLVGLPSSPKPGVTRFPSMGSLPSSPKPGATFSRPNAPTAIRTGGALPLRAYEPSVVSPSTGSHRTKQTVFERAPLSPNGPRTPWTGVPVPYSPYQPFSPVVPITPNLVTKADRKRMKKLEPKTPTTEMVKSDDEVW